MTELFFSGDIEKPQQQAALRLAMSIFSYKLLWVYTASLKS